MSEVGYYTISQYIESRCGLAAQIEAIDLLMAAMELKLLDVVDGMAYDEYQMDDGQMKVRTKYRSTQDVMNGLTALEALKQRYVNRFNGRIMHLRGGFNI